MSKHGEMYCVNCNTHFDRYHRCNDDVETLTLNPRQQGKASQVTFKEYFHHKFKFPIFIVGNDELNHHIELYAKQVWDYQQKKIDKLEPSATVLTDEKSAEIINKAEIKINELEKESAILKEFAENIFRTRESATLGMSFVLCKEVRSILQREIE